MFGIGVLKFMFFDAEIQEALKIFRREHSSDSHEASCRTRGIFLPSETIKQAERTCGCGCGNPPTGRSRYYANHFAILKRMRARLRTLKWYAHSRQIPFELVLQDVRDLLEREPEYGEYMAIERQDPRLGFVKGNLILRPRPNKPAAHPPEPMPHAEIQRRLVIAIERQQRRHWKGETPELSVAELCGIYSRQDGFCAMSGESLLLDKTSHKWALTLVRRDPKLGWLAKGNAIFIRKQYEPMVGRYGEKEALKAMLVVIKYRRKRHRKEK